MNFDKDEISEENLKEYLNMCPDYKEFEENPEFDNTTCKSSILTSRNIKNLFYNDED